MRSSTDGGTCRSSYDLFLFGKPEFTSVLRYVVSPSRTSFTLDPTPLAIDAAELQILDLENTRNLKHISHAHSSNSNTLSMRSVATFASKANCSPSGTKSVSGNRMPLYKTNATKTYIVPMLSLCELIFHLLRGYIIANKHVREHSA